MGKTLQKFITTHPLDLIKVRMQLQGEEASLAGAQYAMSNGTTTYATVVSRSGPFRVGLEVTHSEGIKALYSGVSTTLLRQVLYSSTRMGLYKYLKHHWRDETSHEGTSLSLYKKITAALVSGAKGRHGRKPYGSRNGADASQRPASHPRATQLHECGERVVPNGETRRRVVVVDGLRSDCHTRAMLVTAAQLATYDQIKDTIEESHLVPLLKG